MITRKARNEEISRRRARRKNAASIQHKVDDIVNQTKSRSLLDAVDRGAIEEVVTLLGDSRGNSQTQSENATKNANITHNNEVSNSVKEQEGGGEVEEEVDVNYIGSRELRPIHLAGFAPIAQLLIDHGADINVQSCDKPSGEIYGGGVFSMGGNTPLHYCKNHYNKSVCFLIFFYLTP
jgi:ankyrin repeat protein